MSWLSSTLLFLVILPTIAFTGDTRSQSREWFERGGYPAPYEKVGSSPRRVNQTTSMASDWLDVTYYRLDLRIPSSFPSIYGSVRVVGICKQDHPPFVSLDLVNSMNIDSVKIGGVRKNFVQQATLFTVALDSFYHSGDILSVDVYYAGLPVPTGFGSFILNSHSGTPWVWSLSEPYGARDWWPCKDTPSDKADSVDIFVTCDSTLTVGSNGKLVNVGINPDGTATTHWQERYPIATYLVSIALTNYARFSNWFHYSPTDSLEVLNYVLPESLSSARQMLPHAVDGLAIFSNMFGLYPFVKEKYGHSQFSSGAMEHQTMTSITVFNEETIIHELAHQWFGDMITCASWPHLWLNEGFATYCTALYLEAHYGGDRYRDFMVAQFARAQTAVGSVYSRDTSDVYSLFNGARVYSKGASVLHMLRHVLGDSVFFRSMYAYANDSSLKFRSAVTDDFRRSCELVSRKDLGYFFDEWVYGEKYPSYVYSWKSLDSLGTTLVRLTIRQTTGTASPSFFKMPIDVKMTGESWDSTVTVLDSSRVQSFSFRAPEQVISVVLDPDGWILKTVFDETAFLEPTSFSLSPNYPNPFNASTAIRYTLPRRARINVSVYDILGRRVATLVDATQNVGTYVARWAADNYASGVYLYRLETREPNRPVTVFSTVRKMVLLK